MGREEPPRGQFKQEALRVAEKRQRATTAEAAVPARGRREHVNLVKQLLSTAGILQESITADSLPRCSSAAISHRILTFRGTPSFLYRSTAMVKRGIHPVLKQMTVVFRNGASVRVNTVANRSMPYVMQAVRLMECDGSLGSTEGVVSMAGSRKLRKTAAAAAVAGRRQVLQRRSGQQAWLVQCEVH